MSVNQQLAGSFMLMSFISLTLKYLYLSSEVIRPSLRSTSSLSFVICFILASCGARAFDSSLATSILCSISLILWCCRNPIVNTEMKNNAIPATR